MKRLIISLVLMVGMFVPALASIHAYAADDASKSAACTAIGGTLSADGKTCDTGQGKNTSPESIVNTVINLFSWVVGAVAVIMLVYGGFRYVTSSGDSGKITSARNTIIYALIGLVIVALSQIIVNFVLFKTNCTVNSSSANCQKK